MPFDPILTDEKLDEAPPRERDVDTVMLVGCSGFVAVSIFSYLLSIWPFFTFQHVHLAKELGFALVLAAPALMLGGYASRRFGLPSACGFVGGGLATAIFLYLRLSEVQLRRGNKDLEQPDYPESWVWIVPAVWVVLVVFLALVTLKREEIDIEPRKPPN